MIGTAPAEAVGTRYPFCIHGPRTARPEQCTFASYEQCQATASGRLLSCIANPYYTPARVPIRAPIAAAIAAAPSTARLLTTESTHRGLLRPTANVN